MIFTFFGKKYEIPPGIDIKVFKFDDGCIDFDVIKDGEPIAMLGGKDEQGSQLPTWEDLGIRKI